MPPPETAGSADTPAAPAAPQAASAPEAPAAQETRAQRVGALGTDGDPGSPSGGPLLGTRWSVQPLPEENRLIAALPPDAQDRLRRRLEPVELAVRQQLWEKDSPITHVYFPLNGVVSMIAIVADGSSVEVASVGREGLAGLPAFLGAATAPVRCFSQIPGVALRLTAAALREEVSENAPLRDLLQRYTQALFAMVAQVSACNRVHSARQRLALWLLMARDRVGAGTFPMTQEFLARMVGVRRQTVSEELASVQVQGILEFRRGILTLHDLPGLQRIACECYDIITAEYDRLLTPKWS